jgi:hypothetical protein
LLEINEEPLKGLGHQMGFLLKTYKVESLLYVHAPLVLTFLGCLAEEKNEHKDFACFYEKPY